MIRLQCETSEKWQSKLNSAWDDVFANRSLGYWQLPDRDENWTGSKGFAEKLKSYDRLIVIGMGGSALGGRLLVNALSGRPEKVHFVSNSDPKSFLQLLRSIKAQQTTAWLLISKSGTTLEVVSMITEAQRFYREQKWNFEDHAFVITEPKKSPLADWASELKLPIHPHPLDVGGRFSGLSPVGLVPAAFAGVNLEELRRGARLAIQDKSNVLGFASSVLQSFERGELITVFWSYIEQLDVLLPWLQQLWAESLGKSPKVPVSTPLPSYGTQDQHSVLQQYMEGASDKYYVFFRSAELASCGRPLTAVEFKGFEYLKTRSLGQVWEAEARATAEALVAADRHISVFEVDRVDAATVGYFVVFFELLIGVLGGALNIDAYNQPGVEAGKKIARGYLEEGRS